MPAQIDSTFKNLRPAAIVTTSYVGNIILPAGPTKPREFNQLALYLALNLGSLTTFELKIEFSPYNGTSPTFYWECDETSAVASNLDTKAVNTVIHQFTLTGNYRLLIPITDEQIKVSIKGTGTVAGSSAQIDYGLIKNFA